MSVNRKEKKPIIHRVDVDPIPKNPWFDKKITTVPAKEIPNLKGDMRLLDLYTKGALKWEDTGITCGNCVNFYPDPNLPKHHGRCKARGFMRVHEDLAADDRKRYTNPMDGSYFPEWPKCPYYLGKERLSRH